MKNSSKIDQEELQNHELTKQLHYGNHFHGVDKVTKYFFRIISNWKL